MNSNDSRFREKVGEESIYLRISELKKGNIQFTDSTNALRLAREFGRDIRYFPAWKKWVVWNGRFWETDESGALVVDSGYSKKYKGIGTFMIDSAERLAWACNSAYCAARFLTVDADIEHDNGILTFYEKNGFIPNAELFSKNHAK